MSIGSSRPPGPSGPPVEASGVSTLIADLSFTMIAGLCPSLRPTSDRDHQSQVAHPAPAPSRRRRPVTLDIQEADVLSIALNEGPPCLHVLAHKHGEQLVG